MVNEPRHFMQQLGRLLFSPTLTALSAAAQLTVLPPSVDFGSVPISTSMQIREIVFTSRINLRIDTVTTSCPCIQVSFNEKKGFPVHLNEQERLTATVTLNTEGRLGKIRQTAILKYYMEASTTPKSIPIVINATVVDEDSNGGWQKAAPPTSPSPTIPKMRHYDGTHPTSALIEEMIIFGNDSCDYCQWVKSEWLPKVHKTLPFVVVTWVDVTQIKGVELLVELEKKFNGDPTQNIPAVFWKGRLTYGTSDIANLSLSD